MKLPSNLTIFPFMGTPSATGWKSFSQATLKRQPGARLLWLNPLKIGKAKYKEQSVRAPDDTPTQYFINPDKSLAQVRKEILGKGLYDIICKAKPELAFNYQRNEATIWCDRKPVCSVKIFSESNARISWMPSRQILYGLDLATIEPAFAEVVATRGEVWT